MDRPRWGLRNITGKMCKAFALEMKLDKLDEHPGCLWIFFQVASCHLGRVSSEKNLQGVPWRPLDSSEALVLKVRRQAAVTGNGVDQRRVVKIHFAMAAATFDHKILTTFDDIF